jgi:predicted transcriptional regulator
MSEVRPRFWGFKPPREVAAAFGDLERRSMETVWARGECSVRDVQGVLGGPIAYTTVMTTLDRLHRKGLLSRRKLGRGYAYAATASRDALERSVAADLLEGLLGGGGAPAQPILSSLVDAVGARDRVLLDELDRLVRAKRRQLRREQR